MITAQDLIDKLQELIKEHGDLEVVNIEEDDVDVEYNNDLDRPVFVIS